jgi:hypothetical protein
VLHTGVAARPQIAHVVCTSTIRVPAWTVPVPSAGRHQCLHLPWQRPVVLLLCWELLGWGRPRLQRARQPIAAAAERAGS